MKKKEEGGLSIGKWPFEANGAIQL